MYKKPSKRKKKVIPGKPNLTPLLDAIFIFIFFLLFSSDLKQIFEIPIDVPIISESDNKESEDEPLGLTLQLKKSSLTLLSGSPLKKIKDIKNKEGNEYDLEELHKTLISIKKENKKEKTIIIDPLFNLEYENLIKILDNIRYFRNTDESIYINDKENGEIKIKELFNKIIFEKV